LLEQLINGKPLSGIYHISFTILPGIGSIFSLVLGTDKRKNGREKKMNFKITPSKKHKKIVYSTKDKYTPVDQVAMTSPSGKVFQVDNTEIKRMKSLGWMEIENAD
jgi:hypothetical protein